MWPFRLFILCIGVLSFLKYSSKIPVLSVYLVFCVFSYVQYVIYDYPLHLFVNDLAFYVSPILVAYIGVNRGFNSTKFYKYTLYAVVGMFIVGLYLFFLKPDWYQNAWVLNYNSRWYKAGMNADFDYIQANMRFSSFMMSSYATEYFGLFAFPFSLSAMMTSKNKRDKIIYTFTSILVFFVIILSFQRAAIGASLAILFVVGIYDLNHNKRAKSFYVYGAILCVALICYFSASDLGQRVIERFREFTLENVFSEARISQNKNLLGAWTHLIFGNGLGTGGNEARKMGLPAVTDSQYVKILVEQGVLGFSIFILFVVSTCQRIVRNFKYLVAEGAFFAGVLVAMIGSNSLMFSLYIVPFWYVVGRIWNDDYIDYKIRSDNYI